MKIKNLITIAAFTLILSLTAIAEVPQGITHQAVVRDASNNLVINSAIGVRLSILQGSASGPVVYSETHSLQSNANGLISFVIGEGTVLSGVFNQVDWSDGPSFVKTELDPAGGVNYSITGVSQMLSVPYAFVAQSVSSIQLPALLVAESGLQYHLNIDGAGNLTTSIALGQPCPGQNTVTDADGNVYNTVLIGNQCWMKENLKTTKYSNGSSIAYPGTNTSSWQNNTNGAYAWYGNDLNWKDSYGALYNWYATSNANGLCPTGWRVPSDADFTELSNYVVAQGYPNIWDNLNGSGAALKSCRQVNSLQGGSCNTSTHPRWNSNLTHSGLDVFGFSGFAGGLRFPSGAYIFLAEYGYWWSSTLDENDNNLAKFFQLGVDNSGITRGIQSKPVGYSVRCIKN